MSAKALSTFFAVLILIVGIAMSDAVLTEAANLLNHSDVECFPLVSTTVSWLPSVYVIGLVGLAGAIGFLGARGVRPFRRLRPVAAVALVTMVMVLPTMAAPTNASPAGQTAPNVVTDGLSHHWKLDEGSGTSIADSVGSATGTLNGTGSPWANNAQDGSAILSVRSATSDHVSVPSTNLTMPDSSAWSMAAVLYVPFGHTFDSQGSFAAAVSHMDPADADKGWEISIDQNGVRAVSRNAGTTSIVTQAITEAWQYWLVVQMVFDGTNLKLQVNKKQASAAADFVTVSGVGLGIGARNDGTMPTSLNIADVLYYPAKALSDAELDDNFDALYERVNGSVTINTPDTSIDKTVVTTPWTRVASFAQLSSTPLATNGQYVFAMDIEDDPENATKVQAVAGRYDKNAGSWDEDVVVQNNQDEDVGHTGPLIGADEDNIVHMSVGRHQESFLVKRGQTANSVAGTLSSDTDPSGGDTWTYQGLYRDGSASGKLWQIAQVVVSGGSSTEPLRVYTWNTGTNAWDEIGNPLVQETGLVAYEPTLYITTDGGSHWQFNEWRSGTGAPRKNGSLAYTDDGGTTWYNPLTDNSITLPITRTKTATVFPNSTEGSLDLLATKLAVANDDTPHPVAAWTNALMEDSSQSLYYARWSATGNYFTYHRLFAHDTAGVGFPEILLVNGTHLVILAPGSEDGATQVRPFYAYISDDDGLTFDRRELHNDGSINYERVNVDRTKDALDTDAVARFLPYSDTNVSKSEMWEFDPASLVGQEESSSC